MSGIFLFFDPDGLSSTQEQTFRERLRNRVSRMPNQVVDTLLRPKFMGAASHHGILPSGGVAGDDHYQVLSTGSCWIEPDAESLATPAEILATLTTHTAPDRPPCHGAYALAHCDHDLGRLTVEADRWTVYPLYYRQVGRGVAVSSALKFLVQPGEETVDPEAMAEWLTMGFMPRSHTAIQGIKRLPANSRLVCDGDGLHITHYPPPAYTRHRRVDGQALDDYDNLFRRFLRRFKDVAPTFCISMSGGLDSRLVGMAALREGMDLSAFTIGEDQSLDAVMAGHVCRQMNIPLVSHVVDGSSFPAWFGKTVWFTEGRALPEHLHYMTCHFNGDTPAGPQLHGLMGEAVLGGHMDNAQLQTAPPDEIRQKCRDMVTPAVYWPPESLPGVMAPELTDHATNLPDRIAEEVFSHMDFDGTYSNYLDFKFRLKGSSYMNPCIISQVIPWSDVINPFSDPEAWDLGATFALEDIVERGGQIKWGLRHLPEIAKLPRVKAGVLIDVQDGDPEAYNRGVAKLMRADKIRYVLCRLSRGRINLPLRRSFPEYGGWYRRWKPVRDYVDGILLDERTLERGILQREGLTKLLHDLRIGRNVWGAVGTCLMTEIFLRQFVDGTDLPTDPVTPLGLDP